MGGIRLRRKRGVPIVQRVSQFSDRTIDNIALWAICTAVLLTPLVFDGWMYNLEGVVTHALGFHPPVPSTHAGH